MSLKNNAGCALLITWLTAIIFSFFIINTQPVTQGNLGKIETPSPSLVSTVEPPIKETVFIVANSEVLYGHTYALNCQRVIAGGIKYTDETEIPNDINVVIQMLEDSGNTQMGYMTPGTNPEYGASGWSVLLPHYSLYFLVWLQNISTGEILSPEVPITHYSCEDNLAIVNFVQVKPVP